MRTVLKAGLLCGVCDIAAAFVVYGITPGISPIPLLQGIAAGLLGPAAAHGGLLSAGIGLACHFFIALTWAAVFTGLNRRLPILAQRAIITGPIFGVFVYFFMQRVVVPLSRARRPAFSIRFMIIGCLIHICCVGLPIALTVRRAMLSERLARTGT